jgi:Periplasmic serine proteases (ClpP class)
MKCRIIEKKSGNIKGGNNLYQPINDFTRFMLNNMLTNLEEKLDADVFFFHSSIGRGIEGLFLKLIEELKEDEHIKNKIYVILTTTGGSAEVVERLVNILRHNYEEVNFIVPDYAYSAGTIFCMSGDKILMDYYSTLGPIDPQVQNKDGKWVAALGYLDKIEELLNKAKETEANKRLTDAEFLILKDFDLAELRSYEQAKDLTIDLLKKWLVKYKFKNWTNHSSTGLPVTEEEKNQKAEEIAHKLGDHKVWKSHGRTLSISELRDIKLQIEDYGQNKELHKQIREYYELITDYMIKNQLLAIFHTRRFL